MWIESKTAPIAPPKKFVMPKAHRDELFSVVVWWNAAPRTVQDKVLSTADKFNENMQSHVLDLFFDNCTNVHKVEGSEDPPYVITHFEVDRQKVYAMVCYDHKPDQDKVEIVGE